MLVQASAFYQERKMGKWRRQKEDREAVYTIYFLLTFASSWIDLMKECWASAGLQTAIGRDGSD